MITISEWKAMSGKVQTLCYMKIAKLMDLEALESHYLVLVLTMLLTVSSLE